MYTDATMGRRAAIGRIYLPPTDVAETTVGTLLGDARIIPREQQARFGFSSEEQRGSHIWCAGDLSLVQKRCVAIVGTRKVSSDGAARARRLAKELVAKDIVIVSGLATGVDTEAMQAAIATNGKTVGVIGTPIDKAYPASNAALQEIIYTHHLLISQFASGSRVFKGNFPTRNKLMAALSDATVIVEASDTSGTIHQAAECMRLGRWLFIAKSVVDNKELTWPSRFLGQAKVQVLSSIDDVLGRIL